jgi:hypothetical protein
MAIGNCGRNGTVNCGQKDTVLWSKRHPGLFSISRSLSLSLCLCFLWRGISAASRIKKKSSQRTVKGEAPRVSRCCLSVTAPKSAIDVVATKVIAGDGSDLGNDKTIQQSEGEAHAL